MYHVSWHVSFDISHLDTWWTLLETVWRSCFTLVGYLLRLHSNMWDTVSTLPGLLLNTCWTLVEHVSEAVHTHILATLCRIVDNCCRLVVHCWSACWTRVGNLLGTLCILVVHLLPTSCTLCVPDSNNTTHMKHQTHSENPTNLSK